MSQAARVGDEHICPAVTGGAPHVGGPIAQGAGTVTIGGRAAARVGDTAVCKAGPPDVIAGGSASVTIEGRPAARALDAAAHGGTIVAGEPTVIIGSAPGGASLADAARDGSPLVDLDA